MSPPKSLLASSLMKSACVANALIASCGRPESLASTSMAPEWLVWAVTLLALSVLDIRAATTAADKMKKMPSSVWPLKLASTKPKRKRNVDRAIAILPIPMMTWQRPLSSAKRKSHCARASSRTRTQPHSLTILLPHPSLRPPATTKATNSSRRSTGLVILCSSNSSRPAS